MIKDKFFRNLQTNEWIIQHVQANCDLVTLNSGFENKYHNIFANGGYLPIKYNSFIVQMQTVTGLQDLNVNVARTLSRLKSVFVSFGKNIWKSGVADGAQPTGVALDRFHLYGSKEWNDFFSFGSRFRRLEERVHSTEDEFNYQIQIGSKLFL